MCCDGHLERADAVLAIHAPCHTADTEDYGCIEGHYGDGEPTGKPGPGQPAVCIACTYDDRVVIYPCPTAIALGVQPGKENTPA